MWRPAALVCSRHPLTQVAGDISINRSIFGFSLYTIPLASDGIVPISSAHGYLTSGPGGTASPGEVVAHSTTDSCTTKYEKLLSLLRGSQNLSLLALDYLTLKDLQSSTFTPTVQSYLAAAVALAPCSHIHITTDQSAINQTTEAVKTAVDTLKESAGASLTFRGMTITLPAGWTVDSSPGAFKPPFGYTIRTSKTCYPVKSPYGGPVDPMCPSLWLVGPEGIAGDGRGLVGLHPGHAYHPGSGVETCASTSPDLEILESAEQLQVESLAPIGSKKAEYRKWRWSCANVNSGNTAEVASYIRQDWYLPKSQILITDRWSTPGLANVLARLLRAGAVSIIRRVSFG